MRHPNRRPPNLTPQTKKARLAAGFFLFGWGTRITRRRFAVRLARWADLRSLSYSRATNVEARQLAGLSHVWLGD